MTTDPHDSGAQAWIDGKAPADCPYSSDPSDDYPTSQACMRQAWLDGMRHAATCNRIAAGWR